MPPKKDLDTASQIDSIFDRPNDGDSSVDPEIVLSHDSTKERSHSDSPESPLQQEDSSAESAKRKAEKSSNEEKERLPGPYVPKSVAWKLDEVQVQLRRATGEKLSQSLIIECALRICLRDFEERGEEGVLAQAVRGRT